MNEKSEQNRMDMSEHTFSESDFEYSIIVNISWLDWYLTLILSERKSKFVDRIYQISELCNFFSYLSRLGPFYLYGLYIAFSYIFFAN